MTAAATVIERAASTRGRVPAMVSAEILKLRKRRGLFWSALVLTLGPILVGYSVLAVRHAIDAERFGPAGGIENLRASVDLFVVIGSVVAIMVGITAGGGDLGAGVFRELVVTGRSRLALFAVRIPGGVLFLVPFVAVTFAGVAAASVLLAGSEPTPDAALLAKLAGSVGLSLLTAYLLAVGVGSLLSTRVATGIVLGWQLALAPILLQTGKLDAVLPGAALERLEPGSTTGSMSAPAAVLVLAAWSLVPLALGAWRTATRDV
jgi:hypothetical protein